MPLTTRPSKPNDAQEIDALCTRAYSSQPGASVLIETSLLCLTAVDSDTDQLVGFICLDDSASVRFGTDPGALNWVKEKSATKFNSSTAFVWVAAFNPDYELEAAGLLLRAVFLTITSLSTLFMACDNDLTFTEPGLGEAFTRIGHGRDESCYLYEAARSAVLPPLVVRQARVEDHDDMVPVLEASEKRYPALAKLPENCRPEEAFALTRLVASQDESNCVLVALDGKKLAGFMVLTSEVDTANLLGAFALHPFDNFLPENIYDMQHKAAEKSAKDKKLAQLREEHQAMLAAKQAEQAEREEVPEGEEEQVEEQKPDEVDLEAASVPTEEEIRQEMVNMFSHDDDVFGQSTLFAITMFCVLEEYESQVLEFMQQAFQAFPEKQYCVVTLPHNSDEPSLMASMTRLLPLPGANFSEVLYLFNRNALLDGFDVRLAAPGDADGISVLVSGMPNSDILSTEFQKAQALGTAVIASCQGEVVGLVTISPQGVDLESLQANFALASLINMPDHPKDRHGEIDVYCMNPIFAHRHRDLLAGAQRLLKLSCLYYALPPGQAPPDMLDVLQQVPPRHRQLAAEFQTQFALYMFTRKGAFLRKRAVNAQIIVVGASECGLAAVERLLLDTELSFNYITVLAPGGINVGGPACEYTAGLVAMLGLEARVNLVDAELIGLDVTQRVAELSDGSHLAYDLLLITSGLQEQTRSQLGETDPEVAGAVVNALELGADFTIEDAARMRDIVVYGHTLDAYHALSVLEKRGAADTQRFIAPPGEQSPLVDVLLHCADVLGRAKCALPAPKLMNLTGMQSRDSSSRPHAYFQGPGAEDGSTEELVIDLLVGCRQPDVSPWVFACLNDAGIVYDSRIVVDGAFRTSDPSIYAAGTAAKLSRRYGRNVLYEHYNSKECGHKLAESIASLFFGTPANPEQPPAMSMARVAGCDLPGGMSFLYAGVPTAMLTPSIVPPVGGRLLQTSTQWGLMQVYLDAAQRVHSAVYLGTKEMQASKLCSLVGLHNSYLNNLTERYEAGQIPDLILFFSEPWADLLHHDQFGDLRAQLLGPGYLMDALVSGADEHELAAHLRGLVLEFIKARQPELPAFNLPTAA